MAEADKYAQIQCHQLWETNFTWGIISEKRGAKDNLIFFPPIKALYTISF